jgi:hypothetical protein
LSEEKKTDEKKISRRAYLKYAGGVVAVGAIAAGYARARSGQGCKGATKISNGKMVRPLDRKSFLSSLI